MSEISRDSLSPTLCAHLEAFDQVTPGRQQLEQARRRLLDRVTGATRPQLRAPRTWLALATAGLFAVLVLGFAPLAFRGSDAFANVLQHFHDFRTLSLTIEQNVAGEAGLATRVLADREGNVRTDTGSEVSVIINASQRQMVVLLHSAKQALPTALPATAAFSGDSALAWVDEIRKFKEQARALQETRVIDGTIARGWALDLPSSSVVLWADDRGLPLAIELPGNGIELRYRLRFDEPLPADSFSVTPPAGYAVVGADAD